MDVMYTFSSVLLNNHLLDWCSSNAVDRYMYICRRYLIFHGFLLSRHI
jgi:hypothetical protein